MCLRWSRKLRQLAIRCTVQISRLYIATLLKQCLHYDTCTAYIYHSVNIHRVRVRCFKHAENNVHVRREGYSEHVRHTVHVT